MRRTTQEQTAETSRTELTRFNALRHGLLSRYTVLPWEDADGYQAIVAALVAEYTPQGPTEEHLVEEIAGIMWRKRRLRLAEAAAHRRGLEGTLAPCHETVNCTKKTYNGICRQLETCPWPCWHYLIFLFFCFCGHYWVSKVSWHHRNFWSPCWRSMWRRASLCLDWCRGQ
jgi:hypothetical protein